MDIQINIPLPYGFAPPDLRLEPGEPWHESLGDALRWMANEIPSSSFSDEDEAERICRAAVVLYWKLKRDGKPVPFSDCLSTAIVWERG